MARGPIIDYVQKLQIANLRLLGKSVDTIAEETGLKVPAIRRLCREDSQYHRIENSLVKDIIRTITSGLILAAPIGQRAYAGVEVRYWNIKNFNNSAAVYFTIGTGLGIMR